MVTPECSASLPVELPIPMSNRLHGPSHIKRAADVCGGLLWQVSAWAELVGYCGSVLLSGLQVAASHQAEAAIAVRLRRTTSSALIEGVAHHFDVRACALHHPAFCSPRRDDLAYRDLPLSSHKPADPRAIICLAEALHGATLHHSSVAACRSLPIAS